MENSPESNGGDAAPAMAALRPRRSLCPCAHLTQSFTIFRLSRPGERSQNPEFCFGMSALRSIMVAIFHSFRSFSISRVRPRGSRPSLSCLRGRTPLPLVAHIRKTAGEQDETYIGVRWKSVKDIIPITGL